MHLGGQERSRVQEGMGKADFLLREASTQYTPFSYFVVRGGLNIRLSTCD